MRQFYFREDRISTADSLNTMKRFTSLKEFKQYIEDLYGNFVIDIKFTPIRTLPTNNCNKYAVNVAFHRHGLYKVFYMIGFSSRMFLTES